MVDPDDQVTADLIADWPIPADASIARKAQRLMVESALLGDHAVEPYLLVAIGELESLVRSALESGGGGGGLTKP